MADLKEMIGSRMTDTPSGWGTMFGEALGGATAQLTAGLKQNVREAGLLKPRITLASNAGIKYTDEGSFLKDWFRENKNKFLTELPKRTQETATSATGIYEKAKDNPQEIKKWLLTAGLDWQKKYEKKLDEELPTYDKLIQMLPLIIKQKDIEQRVGRGMEQFPPDVRGRIFAVKTLAEKDVKIGLDKKEKKDLNDNMQWLADRNILNFSKANVVLKQPEGEKRGWLASIYDWIVGEKQEESQEGRFGEIK